MSAAEVSVIQIIDNRSLSPAVDECAAHSERRTAIRRTSRKIVRNVKLGQFPLTVGIESI